MEPSAINSAYYYYTPPKKQTKEVEQSVEGERGSEGGAGARDGEQGAEEVKVKVNPLIFDSSGFQLLVVTASNYHPLAIYPSHQEIRPYLDSPSISHVLKLRAFRSAMARELKEGDLVKIVAGPDWGSIGNVDGLALSHAYVRLLDKPGKVQVHLSLLRRHFKIGDLVRIKAGANVGACGNIVEINDTTNSVVVCDAWAIVRPVSWQFINLMFLL